MSVHGKKHVSVHNQLIWPSEIILELCNQKDETLTRVARD